jgi:hypothetical protein
MHGSRYCRDGNAARVPGATHVIRPVWAYHTIYSKLHAKPLPIKLTGQIGRKADQVAVKIAGNQATQGPRLVARWLADVSASLTAMR